MGAVPGIALHLRSDSLVPDSPSFGVVCLLSSSRENSPDFFGFTDQAVLSAKGQAVGLEESLVA